MRRSGVEVKFLRKLMRIGVTAELFITRQLLEVVNGNKIELKVGFSTTFVWLNRKFSLQFCMMQVMLVRDEK